MTLTVLASFLHKTKEISTLEQQHQYVGGHEAMYAHQMFLLYSSTITSKEIFAAMGLRSLSMVYMKFCNVWNTSTTDGAVWFTIVMPQRPKSSASTNWMNEWRKGGVTSMSSQLIQYVYLEVYLPLEMLYVRNHQQYLHHVSDIKFACVTDMQLILWQFIIQQRCFLFEATQRVLQSGRKWIRTYGVNLVVFMLRIDVFDVTHNVCVQCLWSKKDNCWKMWKFEGEKQKQ